jgi:hypothetical protein
MAGLQKFIDNNGMATSHRQNSTTQHSMEIFLQPVSVDDRATPEIIREKSS